MAGTCGAEKPVDRDSETLTDGRCAEKAKPGDPLVVPAATFNTFVDAPKAIVKKPVAVYAEKVYEEGNLAGLGIGT